MPPLSPVKKTCDRNVLPPVRGTMLIVGPPTSVSPRPPAVVIAISAAFSTSCRYPETPPPLSEAPVFSPSTCARPSLPRPPRPPNTTMPGLSCTLGTPPPLCTIDGISTITAA